MKKKVRELNFFPPIINIYPLVAMPIRKSVFPQRVVGVSMKINDHHFKAWLSEYVLLHHQL